jgi:hypothetical protein
MKIKYFLALWGLCYGNETSNLNISCRKTDNVNDQKRINWFLDNVRKAREIQTGLCQLTTPAANDTAAPVTTPAANDTAAPVTLVNQNPVKRILEINQNLDSLDNELRTLFQGRRPPETGNYSRCIMNCWSPRMIWSECQSRCQRAYPNEVRLQKEWNRVCGGGRGGMMGGMMGGPMGGMMQGPMGGMMQGPMGGMMGSPMGSLCGRAMNASVPIENLEAGIEKIRGQIAPLERELNRLFNDNKETLINQIAKYDTCKRNCSANWHKYNYCINNCHKSHSTASQLLDLIEQQRFDATTQQALEQRLSVLAI